ncbi:E3 ubiquitin/ISG15 ligase TRIM25-like [Gastrophryne carolinensis]
MSSTDVREELECSICLSIYTDPVTLGCGHNFCRACIDRALKVQDVSGAYNCPECRQEFYQRPTMRKNINLSNIVARFHTPEKSAEASIRCTYCIHAAVAAVKTCLLCESSLCADHLTVHSASPEHVLIQPTASLARRKCPVHKKILEYYCTKDAAYICVSCRLDGEHEGHKTCPMKDVADKKKAELKAAQKKLTSVRVTVEKRIRKLKERKTRAEDKAAGESKKVEVLFGDLRKRLEDLEKKVLSEICGRADSTLRSLSHLIKKLETERDELSSELLRIETLVKETDSFTVLQERQSLEVDFLDALKGNDEEEACDRDDLDEGLISETLSAGLLNFVSGVKGKVPVQEAAEIFLDPDTACEDIDVSGDLRTISRSEAKQYHPQRFQYYPQVLSGRSFSSGRYSWEVETSDIGTWRIGVSYPSIDRNGDRSYFGDNNKSWCLRRYNGNQYSVIHDSKEVPLTQNVSCAQLRICLDYESGQLSFYELGDPDRHLHTFTTVFTEPLHAAFCVWDDWIKIMK